MISEQEAKDAIRSWVVSRARSLAPDQIDGTTPLFADGHLISVHVPELLLLLERLRGEPVDPEGLAPGDFRDIDTIVRRFCAPRPVADQEGDIHIHARNTGDLG
jgi:hypothetical protein